MFIAQSFCVLTTFLLAVQISAYFQTTRQSSSPLPLSSSSPRSTFKPNLTSIISPQRSPFNISRSISSQNSPTPVSSSVYSTITGAAISSTVEQANTVIWMLGAFQKNATQLEGIQSVKKAIDRAVAAAGMTVAGSTFGDLFILLGAALNAAAAATAAVAAASTESELLVAKMELANTIPAIKASLARIKDAQKQTDSKPKFTSISELSCSSRTITNYYIYCLSAVHALNPTQSCSTVSSVVSGCSVTATTSVTVALISDIAVTLIDDGWTAAEPTNTHPIHYTSIHIDLPQYVVVGNFTFTLNASDVSGSSAQTTTTTLNASDTLDVSRPSASSPPRPTPSVAIAILFSTVSTYGVPGGSSWILFSTKPDGTYNPCEDSPGGQALAPDSASPQNLPYPSDLKFNSDGLNCNYTGTSTTIGSVDCPGFDSPVECRNIDGGKTITCYGAIVSSLNPLVYCIW
ncbi:hypothetical protein V8E54_002067 [Elaphomyces granulatus]